jgi:hypothetical protein
MDYFSFEIEMLNTCVEYVWTEGRDIFVRYGSLLRAD